MNLRAHTVGNLRSANSIALPRTSTAVPIAVANLQTSGSTGNQAQYNTASFSIAAGQLALMAIVSARTGGAEAPTFAGTMGGTWTLIDEIAIDADRRLGVYRSLQGSARTGVIQIIHAQAHESCLWMVLGLTNINPGGSNGADAIAQSNKNSVAAGTALSITLASFTRGENLCVAFCGADVNGTITTGAGFTQVTQTGQATLDVRLQGQHAFGNNAPGWTFGTRDVAGIAVEVRAA